MRIVPDREMATVTGITGVTRRAVRQEDRVRRLVCRHVHREAAHHIRTVGIEGDAPEADGLALCAEPPSGHVQSRQGRILRRCNLDVRNQGERVRNLGQRQPGRGQFVGRLRHRCPVDRDRLEDEFLTVQHQRCIRITRPADLQLGPDTRRIRVQVELQVHLLDFERKGRIVRQLNRDGGFSAHVCSGINGIPVFQLGSPTGNVEGWCPRACR